MNRYRFLLNSKSIILNLIKGESCGNFSKVLVTKTPLYGNCACKETREIIFQVTISVICLFYGFLKSVYMSSFPFLFADEIRSSELVIRQSDGMMVLIKKPLSR